MGLITGMPRCENFSSHGRKGIKVSEENPTLYQKDQENFYPRSHNVTKKISKPLHVFQAEWDEVNSVELITNTCLPSVLFVHTYQIL